MTVRRLAAGPVFSRGFLRFFGAVSILLAALAITAPAQANSRYAALVMNAETGDVIYSRNADLRRYPASLTKVMTLYMLFEAIEEGRVAMDDELYVSRHADRQPASDLGVEEGSTITVEDAIQALVIRSANDVAVVVAEALSDSEWQFARDMTARAQEMGMNLTRFENASGLPHNRQQTTARDLAIMTMRLMQDFPQYMHYFSQESFTYNGRTWTTHNHLVGEYEGTTGLKTGYIRASGFNLIATVDREGHSLIGIVMGGRTAARRDAEMERILDLNFARLEENPHFGSRVYSSDIRPVYRPDPNDWTPRDTDDSMLMADAIIVNTSPEPRPENVVPPTLVAMPSPAPNPLESFASTVTEGIRTANDNVLGAADGLGEMLTADLADDELEQRRPSGDAEGVQVAALNTFPQGAGPEGAGDVDSDAPLVRAFPHVFGYTEAGEWGVTIGEFNEANEADHNLRVVAAQVPTMLTWGMAALFPENDDDGVTFDAAFGPMTEDDAVEVCSTLAQTGLDCVPAGGLNWDTALRR